MPYDLQVLEGARDGWFNAIHAHGDDIMFDLVKDYPVQVFNWHVWESLPELKEGIDYTNKCVMAALHVWILHIIIATLFVIKFTVQLQSLVEST